MTDDQTERLGWWIAEASPEQLAAIFLVATRRLGVLGSDGREAVQLALSYTGDGDVQEGIEQLGDAIDGVCP